MYQSYSVTSIHDSCYIDYNKKHTVIKRVLAMHEMRHYIERKVSTSKVNKNTFETSFCIALTQNTNGPVT